MTSVRHLIGGAVIALVGAAALTGCMTRGEPVAKTPTPPPKPEKPAKPTTAATKPKTSKPAKPAKPGKSDNPLLETDVE